VHTLERIHGGLERDRLLASGQGGPLPRQVGEELIQIGGQPIGFEREVEIGKNFPSQLLELAALLG
jgi:hypothetical protein